MKCPGPAMSGHGRLCRAGAMVALVAVAFVAAGCGGGEPQKAVASVAASSGTPSSAAPSATGDPVAYAQCMRANGLPNFPDPGKNGRLALPPGLDPNSPEFRKAQQKCKQHMGSGGDQAPTNAGVDQWPLDKKLKYATCMREHGVPSFPDPGADGQFPMFVPGGAVDPLSEQFKQADKACAQFRPNVPKGPDHPVPGDQGPNIPGPGGGGS